MVAAMTVREALTAAGISQTELSRRSGVNLRQVQKLVAGEILLSNMTAKNALSIADALSIDLRDLLKE